MKKLSGALIALCLVASISCADSGAGAPGVVVVDKPFSLKVGAGTWISQGQGLWDISGQEWLGIGFRSLLEWENLDATMLMLNAELGFGRLKIAGSWGAGDIQNGDGLDTDWFTGWYFGSDYKFSESTSVTSGDSTCFDVNVLFNVYSQKGAGNNPALSVDLLVGYLNYSDDIADAQGVQTLVDETPTYEPFTDQGVNATYTFGWQAVRLGGRVEMAPADWIAFSGDFAALVAVKHEGDGFWVFRDDLWRTPPNMRNEADNGFGTDINLKATWKPMKALSVDVGYRYLYLENRNGVHFTYFADGSSDSSVSLDVVRSIRQGVTAGVNLQY